MSKRGEETKRQILETAVSLFAEGGFRALRITTICERARISPTSVYWHFNNKSGLVQAVLEAAFKPVGESLAGHGSGMPQDADTFLRSLENLVVNQPVGALTMLAYIADSLDDPDLEEAIKRTRRRELKEQTNIISNAMGVDKDSARRLGVLINSCVNYAALVRLTGGSRSEVKQVLDALTSVLR